MNYWFSKGGKSVSLPPEVMQYLLESGIATHFEGGQFIGRNEYSDAMRAAAGLPLELPSLKKLESAMNHKAACAGQPHQPWFDWKARYTAQYWSGRARTPDDPMAWEGNFCDYCGVKLDPAECLTPAPMPRTLPPHPTSGVGFCSPDCEARKRP